MSATGTRRARRWGQGRPAHPATRTSATFIRCGSTTRAFRSPSAPSRWRAWPSPTSGFCRPRPDRAQSSGAPRASRLRRGPARTLFFARIVRGIYVRDGEGALTVDLNDGLARSPGVVIHLGRRLGKSAGPQRHAFLLVELVSHTDVERARKHRDVFSRRMIVRRDLVASGHFQPDDVQALLEGIAGDDGDLSTGRKDIGHGAPFQVVGVRRCRHLLREGYRPAE